MTRLVQPCDMACVTQDWGRFLNRGEMKSGDRTTRQALVIPSRSGDGADVAHALEHSGAFAVVESSPASDVMGAPMPRSAKRGITIIACADETDDDALRDIAERVGEAPVLAVGIRRKPSWIAEAIARGAHACVFVDQDPDESALLMGIESAFALASRFKGHNKMVGDLHASVGELSRRIDHLSTELARLEVMAWTDSLTGLANRRQLEQRLPQIFAEAARYDRDMACMMIDLDGFKQVNDELGHAAGDELLRIAARVIVEETRASDVAARYGGDEFVVLMPETSASMAGAVANRLMESFIEKAKACITSIEEGGEACMANCTMSLGVACLASSSPSDGDELLAHADSALYAAKRSGKSAVMIKTAGGGSVRLRA